MNKQYAVFGLGKFGRSVAISLEQMGCEVVVVDSSEEHIAEIADEVSYAIRADIGDPEVIKSLGVRNLDGAIIAVTEHLETSIMATIVSKELGIPYVIAKAQNELHATILKRVGADAIVFPEMEMGSRVAKSLVSSDFADWVELSPDYSYLESEISERWSGKSIQSLHLKEKYGVSVVGVNRGGMVELQPNIEKNLQKEDRLMIIGSNRALQRFKKEWISI